jgi:hypothetical protein
MVIGTALKRTTQSLLNLKVGAGNGEVEVRGAVLEERLAGFEKVEESG